MLQTDPQLARTVMVSTKLDTRIPQFARGQDVDLFLHPPGRQLEPTMLGGSPFFTCACSIQSTLAVMKRLGILCGMSEANFQDSWSRDRH